MMEKDKFLQLMTGVAELYDKDLTGISLNLYYDLLKGWTYVEFEKAIRKVLANRKYNSIPKPAEILEYLEGTKDDKSLLAWEYATEGVRRAGYYHSPDFKDPIISNCIKQLGGWQWFCSVDIGELPFIEKRFMDLYRLYLKRECDKPVKLCGRLEMDNGNKGFTEDIPAPILIGYSECDLEQIEQ